MKFRWDENKNRANLKKHGLEFELARDAFYDPYALYVQDRYVDGEERWQVIGLIGAVRVIVVAHTYKGESNDEEIIRIISARPATTLERREYDRARLGDL